MTRLELLASHIRGEAKEYEIKGTQQVFSKDLGFWRLCLDAHKITGNKPMEQPKPTTLKVKDDTNK